MLLLRSKFTKFTNTTYVLLRMTREVESTVDWRMESAAERVTGMTKYPYSDAVTKMGSKPVSWTSR